MCTDSILPFYLIQSALSQDLAGLYDSLSKQPIENARYVYFLKNYFHHRCRRTFYIEAGAKMALFIT